MNETPTRSRRRLSDADLDFDLPTARNRRRPGIDDEELQPPVWGNTPQDNNKNDPSGAAAAAPSDAAITIDQRAGRDGVDGLQNEEDEIDNDEGEDAALVKREEPPVEDLRLETDGAVPVPYCVQVLNRISVHTHIETKSIDTFVRDMQHPTLYVSSAGKTAEMIDRDISEIDVVLKRLSQREDGDSLTPGIFHASCAPHYSVEDVTDRLKKLLDALQNARHLLHLRLPLTLFPDSLLTGIDGQKPATVSSTWDNQQAIVGQRLGHQVATLAMAGEVLATEATDDNQPGGGGGVLHEAQCKAAQYYCDGVVNSHPFRLKDGHYGPIELNERTPTLVRTTPQLLLGGMQGSGLMVEQRLPFQVDVTISSLSFRTHDLFHEEDGLVAQLQSLYSSWVEYDRDDSQTHPNHRAVRRLIRQRSNTATPDVVKELEEQMELSKAYEVSVLLRLQDVWEKVLEVRQREGMNRTGVTFGFVRRSHGHDHALSSESEGQDAETNDATAAHVLHFYPKIHVPTQHMPSTEEMTEEEAKRRDSISCHRYFVALYIRTRQSSSGTQPVPTWRYVTRTASAHLKSNFTVDLHMMVRIELQNALEEVYAELRRDQDAPMDTLRGPSQTTFSALGTPLPTNGNPMDGVVVGNCSMQAFGPHPSHHRVHSEVYGQLLLEASVVCSEAVNRARQQYFLVPHTYEYLDPDTVRSRILSGELDICDPANTRLLYKLAMWYGRNAEDTPHSGHQQKDSGCKFLRYLDTSVDVARRHNDPPVVVTSPRAGQGGAGLGVDTALTVSADEVVDWTTARYKRWKDCIERRRHQILGEKEDDYTILNRVMKLPLIPEEGKFFDMVSSFFQPARTLNPYRLTKPKNEEIDVPALDQGKDQSEIVVHIIKGVNMPVRCGLTQDLDKDGRPSNVFIEVSFLGETTRSRAEPGINPSWYESIRLPFKAPGYTAQYLDVIQDDIYITLYDEVEVTLTDRPPSTPSLSSALSPPQDNDEVHYRIEPRYLGHVKVPFASLYGSPTASLEGTFLCDTPSSTISHRHFYDEDCVTSLSLYVSLWPPLRKEPVKPKTILNIIEEPFCMIAKQYEVACDAAANKLASENPAAKERRTNVLVQSRLGTWLLITRYVNPNGIVVPSGIATPNEALHFVRSIPYTSDAIQFEGGGVLRDVWCTASEMFEMDGGDYEEHALLLANFFIAFGMDQVYVVQGITETNPEAAFVTSLCPISKSILLWDPCTAQCWEAGNPRCPLRRVGLVFNHSNIWFNTQISGTPAHMSWDLSNALNWKAFLAPGAAVPPTRQPTRIDFQPIPELVVRDLEFFLYNTVKSVLEGTLRPRNPRWNFIPNRQIGAALRNVLEEYEAEVRKNVAVTSAAARRIHQQHLAHLQTDYQIVGTPLQVPYSTEIHYRLVDLLLQTKVFDTAPNANYAIAVMAAPFVNHIFSLWVYVAAVLPIRNRTL